MRRLPKYCNEFKGRDGKVRVYLRRPGHKAILLPGVPWSAEFMAAYAAAFGGALSSKPAGPGTLDAAARSYYASADFTRLRASTKAVYRRIIDKMVAAHGALPIAGFTQANVRAGLDARAATPHAAHKWLKVLHLLMRRAIEINLRTDDPTAGVRFKKPKSDGFRPWSAEDVAKYRAFHETGTRARLAFELLLCTMQRRGDVVTLGRQHLHNGTLSFKQSKTGTQVDLPVLPELQTELPSGQMTFLLTEQGKPFTANGFGNWFRDRCNEAGVGTRAHGLRKFGAIALAETGHSAREIMAWGGWKTLSEVQHYCEQADNKKLAARVRAIK